MSCDDITFLAPQPITYFSWLKSAEFISYKKARAIMPVGCDLAISQNRNTAGTASATTNTINFLIRHTTNIGLLGRNLLKCIILLTQLRHKLVKSLNNSYTLIIDLIRKSIVFKITPFNFQSKSFQWRIKRHSIYKRN